MLISGGDPLTLSPIALEEIVAALRAIPHVEIIRIGTRVPVVPADAHRRRAVRDAASATTRSTSTRTSTTPKELTPRGARRVRAARRRRHPARQPDGAPARRELARCACSRKLFTELLRCRVRPYYLFQGDVAAGTSHLRTSVETGIALMEELRGHISGMAIPHLVIDTPGGMGKVSIGPDYVVARGPDKWTLRNYEGKLVDYPQPADKDATCAYDEVYFAHP